MASKRRRKARSDGQPAADGGGRQLQRVPEVDGAAASIARLTDAADAMDSWRAEGERRAEALRKSLLDVKDHANDLTGQVNTRNRAVSQGERSRKQHSHLAAGSAKPSQERRIAVPQQDVDPAESAVLNAEEQLQDVRSPVCTPPPALVQSASPASRCLRCP